MSDYIKREDAEKVVADYLDLIGYARRFAKSVLDNAPSADVVERKRGTYHESEEKDEWWCYYYICDECGCEWVGGRNFCPNCGADMRAERTVFDCETYEDEAEHWAEVYADHTERKESE